MSYQKPFSLVQRQRAVAVYRSMRVSLDNMRFHFPPLNQPQRQLARQYRESIRDFARQLARPDAKVDVDRLNELEALVNKLAIDYITLQIGAEGSSHE